MLFRFLFFFFLAGLLLSTPLAAQPISELFGSDNQKILIQATDDCVVSVRQEYVLVGPSGTAYGWESLRYFSFREGFGLLTGKDLIVPTILTSPWQSDERYRSFPSRDTLHPRLSATYVKTAADTEWRAIGISRHDTSATVLPARHTLTVSVPDIHPSPLVDSLQLADHWAVVLHRDSNVPGGVRRSAYRPEVGSDGLPYLSRVPDTSNFIGGVIFQLHYRPAQIQLAPTALLELRNGRGEVIRLLPRGAAVPPAAGGLSPLTGPPASEPAVERTKKEKRRRKSHDNN